MENTLVLEEEEEATKTFLILKITNVFSNCEAGRMFWRHSFVLVLQEGSSLVFDKKCIVQQYPLLVHFGTSSRSIFTGKILQYVSSSFLPFLKNKNKLKLDIRRLGPVEEE